MLTLCASSIALMVALVLAEILIRTVSPQRTMRPRRAFAAEYGFVNYKNTVTRHEVAGQWRFFYTTNQYGNRGAPVPISNAYETPNIVVLGDSHTFGQGVNDGEEYAAVMSRRLASHYAVTNLGVGGWGLTQQIRRYYEFGQLYHPEIVLLQFCINDLQDNFSSRVTVIENDKFRFVDVEDTIHIVKKYLSNSVIQRSHLYNLVRDSIYTFYWERQLQAEMATIPRVEGNINREMGVTGRPREAGG